MKTVLIPSLVAAKNIDTLNASFVSANDDIDNGSVIVAGELNNQVYNAEKPSTDSLSGLYMVFTAEDTIVTDAMGNEYKIGINDPRTFTNVKGKVFSAFKLSVGDKVLISAEGLTGSANAYVEAVDGSYKLSYVATPTAGSTAFKVVDADAYMSIAGASAIGSQRVAAVLLECVAN